MLVLVLVLAGSVPSLSTMIHGSASTRPTSTSSRQSCSGYVSTLRPADPAPAPPPLHLDERLIVGCALLASDFEYDLEALRIPSTKNMCFVSRPRNRETIAEDDEDDEDERERLGKSNRKEDEEIKAAMSCKNAMQKKQSPPQLNSSDMALMDCLWCVMTITGLVEKRPNHPVHHGMIIMMGHLTWIHLTP